MISKLKEECGSQFTNKLEGMFNDMEISKDIMDNFRQTVKLPCLVFFNLVEFLACSQREDFRIQFRDDGPSLDLRLLADVSSHRRTAARRTGTASRNLQGVLLGETQWKEIAMVQLPGYVYCQGKIQIVHQRTPSQSLPGDKLQACVHLKNLLQAGVLFLFNDDDRLSYLEIRDRCGLEDKELKRSLLSLSCGRLKVLLKEPSTAEIEDTDQFCFNEDFQDAHYRIRINTVQIKESDEENQKVNDSILQDRQYQIDAAIVRIMKMRKTLSHKLLVNELATQLRFPFKGIDIKKRIESLIEREYMERTMSDPGVSTQTMPLP